MKKRKIIRTIKNYVLCRYFGAKILLRLDLELTRQCNFRCKHCALPISSDAKLRKSDVIQLIKENEKNLVFISFAGGEPLLYEDLDEVVDYIQSKDGIFTHLVTNASHFREKVALLSRCDLVTISLDGPKAIHEINRPKGSFDTAMEALNLARERGINISVNCVLTKDSAKKIDSILDFFLKNKVRVNFIPLNESSYMSKNYFDKKKIGSAEANLVVEKILSFQKKTGLVVNSKQQLNILRQSQNRLPCYQSRFSVFVNNEGYFQPCCFMKNLLNTHRLGGSSLKQYFKNLRTPNCRLCTFDNNLSVQSMQTLIRYWISAWPLVQNKEHRSH